MASWQEIDTDNAVWTIPAKRTKIRREHKAPLSKQAIEILQHLQKITRNSDLLFPSLRSASIPISENTMNAALRRLGYGQDEMTAHGFRSSASTLLNESGEWRPDVIERALAHVDPDSIRKAYARTEYWGERVKMMQWWADYLDKLKCILK